MPLVEIFAVSTYVAMPSRFLSLVCSGACLLPFVLGQIFVGSNSSESSFAIALPAPGALSSSCNSTFATDVTCDTTLPAIAFSGYFPSSDDLTALCTPDCLQSLDSFRTSQQQSCAADVMTLSGVTYPVTATVDAMLWTYNYTCRRDSASGDFCGPVFDAWASGSASNESCSDCVLGTYQLQLSNSLGYSSDLAANFSSLTSSCHATNYPVTSPPPNNINQTATATVTTTSPTAAKSCSSTYTVKSGDDCHSISNAQQVSTNNMLYLNNLEAGCTDFPAPGKQLCMPHTCQTYTVQQNNTCYGIAASFNGTFTISQLVAWNIDISRGCDNLELLVGNQICVSFPGDTNVVTATASPSTATQAPVPTNIVNGTNTKCGMYYAVRAGDTCASVTQNQGISLPDFYFLNPEVNGTSCNNLYLGYSYCVQAVGNIKTYAGYGGQPTNPCVGDTKLAASSCYATTYSTASAWTFPPINTTSSNATITANYTSYSITPVTAYPVTGSANPTPMPHQSGLVSGCAEFYGVQTNDSCYNIAQRWQISLDNLYSWNPDLHNDCSGLIAGDYICVGLGNNALTSSGTTSTSPPPTSTIRTSTVPTSTATSGGTTPSGPTQPGIPSDCNKWILQQDGVYCYDMANSAGISLKCLYQMNPALTTSTGECQGLWKGYAYCVGTASNECT